MRPSSSPHVPFVRELFGGVFDRVLHLSGVISDAEPQLDLSLDLPAQAGLSLPIHANLQNGDELHLEAASLHVSWFPCNREGVAEAFSDALVGLVEGTFRISEVLRSGDPIGADLEHRTDSGWERVATCRKGFPLWFGKRTRRVVANDA